MPAAPALRALLDNCVRHRVLLACALLLLAAGARVLESAHPLLANDSYQYLSVARNTLAGHLGETSLIQWDEDRSFGRIPAPMTNFPVGYPVLVSAVEWSGVPGEYAGLLVSLASMLLAIVMLDRLCARCGVTARVRGIALLAFAGSAFTVHYAASVLSEPAFTMAVLGGLTLLIAACDAGAADRSGAQLLRAVLAGIALGLAYWLRYAGLFILLGILVCAPLALLARSRRVAARLLLAGAAGLGVAALGMLRNQLLVGSWRGGNNKYAYHSYAQIAHDYAIALKDLLLSRVDFGGAVPAVLRLLIVAALLAALAATVWIRRRAPADRDRSAERAPGPASLLSVVLLTYLACLVYAASRTVIDRDVRYLFPVYPELLALGAVLLERLLARLRDQRSRDRLVAAWALFAAVFAGAHLALALGGRETSRHDLIEAEFTRPLGEGASLRALIDSSTGPGDVIMANNGQAVGYLAERKTVVLVGTENSQLVWTEEAVQINARKYAVKLLVILGPQLGPFRVDLPSPFVEQLAAGQFPSWLRLVGASDRIHVYRVADG